MKSLGFVSIGQKKETEKHRGQEVTLASHHYFRHPVTGLIASIDKFPGINAKTAFYIALAEAQAVPTCFAEFNDAVKINIKHEDFRSRLVIGRVHGGEDKAPDPVHLLRHLEKAGAHQVMLNLSGFPIAPTGIDKYGHLTWLPKQGQTKNVTLVPDTALAATSADIQIGDVEFLPRDKQAPKISRFTTQYGVAAIDQKTTNDTNNEGQESSAPLRFKSPGIGKQREKLQLDQIENPSMKALAEKYNANINIDKLAEELDINVTYLYNIFSKLREDPTYTLQRFREKPNKAAKEAKPKLSPVGRSRPKLDIANLPDIDMQAFVDTWNSSQRTTEIAKVYSVKPATILRVGALLRQDKDYIWPRLKECNETEEGSPEKAKGARPGRKRTPLNMEGITQPDMIAFGQVWNSDTKTPDIAAQYGINPAYLYKIVEALRADSDFVWSRFKQKPEKTNPTGMRKGRTRAPIIAQDNLEKITDPRCRAFAKAWNDGAPMDKLAAEFGISAGRIFQIASQLRADPNFQWKKRSGAPANKVSTFAGSNVRLATSSIKSADTLSFDAAPVYANLTEQEISAAKMRKQDNLLSIRKALASAVAFQVHFSDTDALSSNFTDFVGADKSLKELGFRITTDKSNGHLERYYQHPSGLKIRVRAEDETERPEFTLAFGLFEMAVTPSAYENLRHDAAYQTKLITDSETVHRRVVMYTTKIDADAVGQRLLEIQAAVDNGLFGLCAYNKQPNNIGKAQVVPRNLLLSVNSSSKTLNHLLKQSGLGVENIAPAQSGYSHLESEAIEARTTAPVFNVILAGLDKDTRFMVFDRIRQCSEWLTRTVDANLAALSGPVPSFEVEVVRSSEYSGEGPFYDQKAITEKIDPDQPNILCLGVPRFATDEAAHLIHSFRANNEGMLAIALKDSDKPQDTAKLLNAGFDDAIRTPFHIDELVMRLYALGRRKRNVAATVESYGPIKLHWWNEMGGKRNLERISVSHEDKTLPVHLTSKEKGLLECMAKNPGLARSKKQLLDYTYSDVPGIDLPAVKIIDVFICKTRKKLEGAMLMVGYADPVGTAFIDTVRGKGYMVNANFGRNVQALSPTRSAIVPSLSPNGVTP